MALGLQYVKTARSQINRYLDGIEDKGVEIFAIEELRREIGKLVGDPSLGGAPTGPFETRPIYRFRLEVAGRRLAQIAYEIKDDTLYVLAFSSVPV